MYFTKYWCSTDRNSVNVYTKIPCTHELTVSDATIFLIPTLFFMMSCFVIIINVKYLQYLVNVRHSWSFFVLLFSSVSVRLRVVMSLSLVRVTCSLYLVSLGTQSLRVSVDLSESRDC